MLILGFISILQIIALPGIVALQLLGIKSDSKLQKWLLVFTFSLFANYVIVTALTLFSIYIPSVLYGLILLESGYLFYSYFPKRVYNLHNFSLAEKYKKLNTFLENNSTINRILFISTAIVILFYIAVFLANIGSIFYFIDTVNNYEWNRWAIDFANNILPKYSSHFPQLIPANWSISYVMIGKTDVHFFPKFIMPLFFIGNLLIFLDLALTKKDNRYLSGLIIYGLFAPIVFSLVFIADGNADLPVSFFAFMTFYLLVKYSPDIDKSFISFPNIKNVNRNDIINKYLLVFLLAALAAATKLAGAYVLTITSLLLLFFLLSNRKYFTAKNIIRIFLYVAVICATTLFWYLSAPEVMVSGLNQPEYLSPEGHFAIFIKALNLLYYNWGMPACTFFALAIGISLFNRKLWHISLIMVIIPIVIWMFKYSVDFRNLSFVIPFLSFCSGAALGKILDVFNISQTLKVCNPQFPSINSNYHFNTKNKLSLIIVFIISTLSIFFILSNEFYQLLYKIYQFIYKYYFLNHRITYFIEYDFGLHVDLYQKTFMFIALILSGSAILIISKIRLRTLLILIIPIIFVLNFTFLKKDSILKYQSESFLNVDARNHYQWMNTILEKNQFSGPVYTNFKNILRDKIKREISFKYLEDITKPSLVELENKFNSYIFLRTDKLNAEISQYIFTKLNNGDYSLLLDDHDYLFFLIKRHNTL